MAEVRIKSLDTNTLEDGSTLAHDLVSMDKTAKVTASGVADYVEGRKGLTGLGTVTEGNFALKTSSGYGDSSLRETADQIISTKSIATEMPGSVSIGELKISSSATQPCFHNDTLSLSEYIPRFSYEDGSGSTKPCYSKASAAKALQYEQAVGDETNTSGNITFTTQATGTFLYTNGITYFSETTTNIKVVLRRNDASGPIMAQFEAATVPAGENPFVADPEFFLRNEDTYHTTITFDSGGLYGTTINSQFIPRQQVFGFAYVETDLVDNDDFADANIKTKYENNADTNAFTDAEQTKLSGIATGAEVNVQADWDETDTGSDAYIRNKPNNITDLSTHSVTELNDVTSAGSGEIISSIERTKLSNLSDVPMLSEFYMIKGGQSVRYIYDLDDLVGSYTSSMNISDSVGRVTTGTLYSRTGAGTQTVNFQTLNVTDSISSATFSVTQSQVNQLKAGSGEVQLNVTLRDSENNAVAARDAGVIDIMSHTMAPSKENTVYLNVSDPADDPNGNNRLSPYGSMSAALTKAATFASSDHKQIVVEEVDNYGNFVNSSITGNVTNLLLHAEPVTFDSVTIIDHATSVYCRRVLGDIAMGDQCKLVVSGTVGSATASTVTFAAEVHNTTLFKAGRMENIATLSFANISSGSHIRVEIDRYEGNIQTALDTIPAGVTVDGWIGTHNFADTEKTVVDSVSTSTIYTVADIDSSNEGDIIRATGDITLTFPNLTYNISIIIHNVGTGVVTIDSATDITGYDRLYENDVVKLMGGNGGTYSCVLVGNEDEDPDRMDIRYHSLDSGTSSLPSTDTDEAITFYSRTNGAKTFSVDIDGVSVASFSSVSTGIHALKYTITQANWTTIASGASGGVLDYEIVNVTDLKTVYTSKFRYDL